MEKIINIGILGAGNIVEKVHLPILSAINGISITWICDLDAKKAERLSKQYKIAQSYTNIENCTPVDIILIAIPVGYRSSVWEWAFRNKANVLCEKPLSTTLEEQVNLIRKARESNIEICVCYMRRYYDSMFILKKILASKMFGELKEIFANEGTRSHNTGRGKDWYQLDIKASGGGVLIEKGIHMVDQVFSLLNVDSFSIDDVQFKNFNKLEYDIRIRTTLKVKTENISFNIWNSRSEDLANGIHFHFEKGIVSIGLEASASIQIQNENQDVILTSSPSGEGAVTSNQAFYLIWKGLMDQIKTKKKSLSDIESTKFTTEFIEKTYKLLK